MNLKFIELNHVSWKSLMISEDSLIFSKKEYKSFEKMDEYLKSYKAKEDEDIEVFDFKKILEFKYLEDGSSFSVKRIDYIKKDFSISAKTDDSIALKEIEKILIDKFDFKLSQENAGKWISIKGQVIKLGIALFMTIAFYAIAYDTNNGETIEVSGKRSGLKRLIVSITENIGTVGVLIIGIAICGFIGYKIYKRIQFPPTMNILKK